MIDGLREVGATLDRLWLSAVSDGSDESLQLAEAAQAVHRAIAALGCIDEVA
jgi:hypothetical protein